jgi:hypothetical protein
MQHRDQGERQTLLDAWSVASRDAQRAYEEWSKRRDEASYAAYRACADRADAAQDALARVTR